MSERTEVAILMGGASSEREVSLVSGRAVMEAIDTARYNARPVDLGAVGNSVYSCPAAVSGARGRAAAVREAPESIYNGAAVLAAELTDKQSLPDIVFIALHGRYGEDGTVQGMLELLGIPYTGSGVLASALAMDKIATKRVLESCEVPTPAWTSVTAWEYARGIVPDVADECGFPAIVKPNREGSTIGVTVVHSADGVRAAVEEALRHDTSVLIEKFVRGREITVGILGAHDLQMLPIVEIRPRTGFYDYEAKYTAGLTEKIVPAPLDEPVAARALRAAELTHRAIGCSGMSRVDLIVPEDGEAPTVLEVNTIPGMTPTSLLPRAAQAAGISFTGLISRIIECGVEEGAR